MLKRLGIVKSKNKGYDTFMKYIAPDFLENIMIPSEYVRFCWGKYEKCPVIKNNALNGSIFEIIIATLLTKKALPRFIYKLKLHLYRMFTLIWSYMQMKPVQLG